MTGEVAETLRSINPSDGMLLGEYEITSPDALHAQLEHAAAAQRKWRARNPGQRAAVLRNVARVLRERVEHLATMATAEMGKPIAAARAEVEKCATCCEWYANQVALLAPSPGPTRADEVRLAPLGVLFAIMPWNFPYWQVMRVVAPALLLGNVVLLKHAENVTGCALALRDVIHSAMVGNDAGEGVFDVLVISRNEVPGIIASPHVAAVTLTGSERAGVAVAAAAAEVLKPVVLELGGSDPFLVWHDVDVPTVACAAALARCMNSGQSCIAAKRFLVHDAIYDEFLPAFRSAMQALRVGDPRDAATDVGPLVSRVARETLHVQVQQTLDAGAVATLGCVVPDGAGAFYPPSIVTDIPDQSPMAVDELFGPVAGVWRVHNLDEAIARANSTRFGLGASVWTHEADVAERCARDFDAGSVMINQPVASDPALPFGGVKASGYGRELGTAGLHAFANVKTVRGLIG